MGTGSTLQVGAMMKATNQASEVRSLIDAVVANVGAARVVEKPFYHLEFDRVFPDDVYARMIAAMPKAADYRPLPGRGGGNLREDGTSTRVKIDLFPEYIRHLNEDKRPIWDVVGRALCSAELQEAIARGLAPGLSGASDPASRRSACTRSRCSPATFRAIESPRTP